MKRLGFPSHNFLAQLLSENLKSMYNPGSPIGFREAPAVRGTEANLACRTARVRKVEAINVKRATKRELIVATMISRMIGTPVFSDRTEFSVITA
jgi:hypothetical protein